MFGNMSQIGLTTNLLIGHAETNHGDTEVVSVDVSGSRERTDWKGVGQRSRKLASALKNTA